MAGKLKKTRKKWDNLKQNKNIKLRRDYINTKYIDGLPSITNRSDVEGMRPLTDDEKTFLSKFYGEHVNASFDEDSLLKTTEEAKEKIKLLEEEMASLKSRISDLHPIRDMAERNPLSRRLADIPYEITQLNAKKYSYNMNNARNRCTLNIGKATNTLELRSWGEFDQDLISNEQEVIDEIVLSYPEKLKLLRRLNNLYPNRFALEDIDMLGLNTIYKIVTDGGESFD